jgi:hypothetical protein
MTVQKKILYTSYRKSLSPTTVLIKQNLLFLAMVQTHGLALWHDGLPVPDMLPAVEASGPR